MGLKALCRNYKYALDLYYSYTCDQDPGSWILSLFYVNAFSLSPILAEKEVGNQIKKNYK